MWRICFTREFVIGALTLVGLALLVTVTVSLRNWDFLSTRRTYYVQFSRVQKLDIGAPVLASGVNVGNVAQIEYIRRGEYRVLVTLRIEKDVEIYSDASVQVSPAAVIGDTTINIDAGGVAPDARRLLPGARLDGLDTPPIEELVGDVSDELKRTLAGAGDILNDPENQAGIKTILYNLTDASDKLDQSLDMILVEMPPLIADLRESSIGFGAFLRQAGADVSSTTQEILATSEGFRIAGDEWFKAAQNFDAQIETTAVGIDQVTGDIRAVLDENREPLRVLIASLHGTSRQLDAVADKIDRAAGNLALVTERIEQGRGTIGRLINDPQPFIDLQQLMAGLNQFLTGGRRPGFSLPPERPATPPPPLTRPAAEPDAP